jgi:type VI secretion system protein ImpJ
MGAAPDNRTENVMSLPLKILWAEGLSIGPQQLQQQDRYHEGRLQRIASILHPHLWGVHAVSWNLDGLANNSLAADALSLIFQDGEIYDAPQADALPLPVNLGKLPAAEQSFTFYAALPALKMHGGNLAEAQASQHGARYVQAEAETLDLFTDAISVDVAYLRKSVRLLSHLEPRDAYHSFPVARLHRTASGGFALDPDFMPPSLSIIADAALQRQLNCLLEKLTAKVEALYSRHRQSGKDTLEVHGGDLSSFWMLNTISSASAALTHCAHYGRHHPETLFERLMGLAGALLAFSKKYTLADLPTYDHEDPGPGFDKLDTIIRDLVDTVIATKYFKLALAPDPEKSTHHRGALDDERIDKQTMLYLAINADMAALELVATVPRCFKVAAPDDIGHIVTRALSGMALVHLAQVPPEVPVRPNTYYFSIENKGRLYDNMMEAKAVVIYVPSGVFNGLKVELFGITA